MATKSKTAPTSPAAATLSKSKTAPTSPAATAYLSTTARLVGSSTSLLGNVPTVPSRPNAPIIREVTEHSIQLSWSPPASHILSMDLDYSQRRSSVLTHQLFSALQTFRRESGGLLSDSGSEIDLLQSSSDDLVYYVEEKYIDERDSVLFRRVYKGYDCSHTLTGRRPLTVYQYRLKCSSSAGTSDWSPIVTATTLRAPYTVKTLQRAIARFDHKQLQTILTQNSSLANALDESGMPPLMIACKTGLFLIAEILLSYGADPNVTNDLKKTSLMEAACFAQTQCAELLIEYGADVLAEDDEGLMAFDYALSSKAGDILTLLLRKGMPVDHISEKSPRNIPRYTALTIVAADIGDLGLAQILINNGACLDHVDKQGRTALMHAADTGKLDIVCLLINSGANVLLRDAEDKTALDYLKYPKIKAVTGFFNSYIAAMLESAVKFQMAPSSTDRKEESTTDQGDDEKPSDDKEPKDEASTDKPAAESSRA